MTALVCSVYGGYDNVRPLPPDHGFEDAVLITDADVEVPGWRVVVKPATMIPPRLAAKAPKCHPHLYTDEPDSVWIDGAFEVLPGGRLRREARTALKAAPLTAWRHPQRKDAYEEAAFSAGYVKYRDVSDDLRRQVEFYRRAGMPSGPTPGLWECGMLARRHSEAVVEHGERWMTEICAYTVQDQVSFPFACWTTGVLPRPWQAESHWKCGWVRWHAHRDES